MKTENYIRLTPRMKEAIHELKGLITARFPQAAFVVEEEFDPEGVYLITSVDIADTDEVIAVIGDRLVELQVDEIPPLCKAADPPFVCFLKVPLRTCDLLPELFSYLQRLNFLADTEFQKTATSLSL